MSAPRQNSNLTNFQNSGLAPHRFACRVCDRRFLSSLSLMEHSQSHHGGAVNPNLNFQEANNMIGYHINNALFSRQFTTSAFSQHASSSTLVANHNVSPFPVSTQAWNWFQAVNQVDVGPNSFMMHPQNSTPIPRTPVVNSFMTHRQNSTPIPRTPVVGTREFVYNHPIDPRPLATNYGSMPRPRATQMPESSLSIGGISEHL